MPRKTKEQKEMTIVDEKPKKTNTTAKKQQAKPKSTKTDEVKQKKESSSKKTSSKTKTETTTKIDIEVKKTKNTTSKTKKTPTKKTSTAKTSKTSSTKRKSTPKKKIEVVEYYDLPERYNETTVKLLAQTPNSLFVYWDISDNDRTNYILNYGENFFNTTKPVLIVHNDTMGYSFEVDINDYANSWYLKVQDSKCDYRIELGRRFINNNDNVHYSNNSNSDSNYVHIYTSNKLENPNDRILFNINQKSVFFKNVKSNEIKSKDVTSISFINNIGKIYNIYDMYKKLYSKQNIDDIYNLKNPSSSGSQSFTKGDI